MYNYSKTKISKCENQFDSNIWAKGNGRKERNWNRFVAPNIVDEFLDLMKDEDPDEFMQYTGVLAWICVGMFDSSAKYLDNVVYPSLTSEGTKTACRELSEMLKLADDYPKDEEPTEEESSEPETEE